MANSPAPSVLPVSEALAIFKKKNSVMAHAIREIREQMQFTRYKRYLLSMKEKDVVNTKAKV